MNRSFLILAFVVSLFSASAQDTDTVTDSDIVEYPVPEYSDEVSTDSNATESYTAPVYKGDDVALKKFDQENWKKIVGNRDYEEKTKQVKERKEQETSKMDKSEPAGEETDSAPWNIGFLKIIGFGLVALLIGLIIYKLTKNLAGPGAIKVNKTDLNKSSVEIENIEELDLRSPLAKALAEGNLRLAIRLYYLNLLKALNEGGMIRWKKDKTNREYLSELYLANYFYSEIRGLTLSYEEVWYGEHALPTESLQEIIRNFERINQHVTPAAR
jgi:hypothetical protein